MTSPPATIATATDAAVSLRSMKFRPLRHLRRLTVLTVAKLLPHPEPAVHAPALLHVIQQINLLPTVIQVLGDRPPTVVPDHVERLLLRHRPLRPVLELGSHIARKHEPTIWRPQPHMLHLRPALVPQHRV